MSGLRVGSNYLAYSPHSGEKYNSSKLMYFQENVSENKKRLKVLVALNESSQKLEVANVLSSKKCKCNFVQNGWFCVQKAHNAKVLERPFDLAILSVDLKVLDGFTVATKLRSLNLVKHIIITSEENFYSYELDNLNSGKATFVPFSNLIEIIKRA